MGDVAKDEKLATDAAKAIQAAAKTIAKLTSALTPLMIKVADAIDEVVDLMEHLAAVIAKSAIVAAAKVARLLRKGAKDMGKQVKKLAADAKAVASFVKSGAIHTAKGITIHLHASLLGLTRILKDLISHLAPVDALIKLLKGALRVIAVVAPHIHAILKRLNAAAQIRKIERTAQKSLDAALKKLDQLVGALDRLPAV